MRKKYGKIQKLITPKLMIMKTSGWRHLKEKDKLFLSYEYQKMYTPSPKTAQLAKLPQTENGKLYFSPTFQKENPFSFSVSFLIVFSSSL